MEKIKIKPYAKFLRKDEFQKILPKSLSKRLLGEDNDLFGVVIDIKAFDKIDNPKIFLEYAFGENKQRGRKRWKKNQERYGLVVIVKLLTIL